MAEDKCQSGQARMFFVVGKLCRRGLEMEFARGCARQGGHQRETLR